MKNKTKPFLQTLNGEITPKIPFWFMRQAGRYLPEYRKLRAERGGFLDMVYHPQSAAEVTIQPIRRFGMDAAILFSDILVIPHALGQDLRFETGEGPKLDPIESVSALSKLNPDKIDDILSPIYDTVSLTAQNLKNEGFDKTALIGFAGSPWTVACYMVEGGGSKTFEKVKKWAYRAPDEFQKLIDILIESTTHYLCRQVEAGAEALQLFDSWAGVLDSTNFTRWVSAPTQKIIEGVRAKHPDTPIIGFPREAGTKAAAYLHETKATALGLDYSLPSVWARDNLQSLCPVQGNLDPVLLLTGGQAMLDGAQEILENLSAHPFVFNLGHGVIKETPIAHVEALSAHIRGYKR